MSTLFEYRTLEGERFDQVAYKAYGKATLIAPIIEANPHVPITAKLAAGVLLYIPVLEEVAVKTDKELLPPWKREL